MAARKVKIYFTQEGNSGERKRERKRIIDALRAEFHGTIEHLSGHEVGEVGPGKSGYKHSYIEVSLPFNNVTATALQKAGLRPWR